MGNPRERIQEEVRPLTVADPRGPRPGVDGAVNEPGAPGGAQRRTIVSAFFCRAGQLRDRFISMGGRTIKDSKLTRVNRMIRIPRVMVVDDDGEQLGVLETHEAIAIAEERGLDLVEVAPTARPPVCKIMDYGKFKYEQAK